MLEACMNQGNVLKRIVDVLKDIVDEVNIDFHEEGMAFQAMDITHIALASLVLRNTAFEPYRCDQPLALGVKMSNLSRLLKLAGNDDSITLRAQDDADRLTLLFKSKDNSRMSEFNMTLMDIDQERLSIPESAFDATASIAASEFARIVRDMKNIDASLAISITKEGVTFESKGDIGTGSTTLCAGGAVDDTEARMSTLITCKQDVALNFSLDYLNNFAKAASISQRVNLCMKAGMPLLVEYQIEDKGFLRFFLAPKIE